MNSSPGTPRQDEAAIFPNPARTTQFRANARGPFGVRYKSRLSLEILLMLLVSTSLAASPPPKAGEDQQLPLLTTAREVHELTAKQAKAGYPVLLRGVVTFRNSVHLFIQDSTGGVWINQEGKALGFKPGELLEVEGVTADPQFAPEVASPKFKVLGTAPLPTARQSSWEEMMSTADDSLWVKVSGIVHSATVQGKQTVLDLAMNGGRIPVIVAPGSGPVPSNLVDSEIRIEGVCAADYNQKMQLIGARLFVPSFQQIQIETPAPSNPFALPAQAISSLFQFSQGRWPIHRIHIRGVVIGQILSGALVVKDSTQSLYVQTTQPTPALPGDLVDVLGFPSLDGMAPGLEDSAFRVTGRGPAPSPVRITTAQALSGTYDGDLVQMEGILEGSFSTAEERILVLKSAGTAFHTVLSTGKSGTRLAGPRDGSRLRVTGICLVHSQDHHRPMSFILALRTPADVILLNSPPWWNVSHALLSLGGAILFGLICFAWVGVLRRRVDQQTQIIRTTLESTADGILVSNSQGKVVTYNQKFIQMWRIPEPVLASQDSQAMHLNVLSQLKDPREFLARTETFKDLADFKADDLIEFKDGRVFERHSEPLRLWGRTIGRVSAFRDIT
ncbi:MAG: hypothetical protein ACRD3T_21610, partial [Terriglobia bacterium]